MYFGRRILVVSLMVATALRLGATWGGAADVASNEDPNVLGCVRNLKLIHEALFAYAAEVGELPDKLSDLVDAELLDRRYLLCPEGRESRTTGVRRDELINFVSSESKTWYKWEYQVSDLGQGVTNRENKEKQRKVGAGAWVALVRCDQHSQLGDGLTHINLGYGGGIYFSRDFWESAIVDVIPASYLLSLELSETELENVKSIWERMPGRLGESSSKSVDLGERFNCLLDTIWLRNGSGEDATELLGDDPRKGRILSHGGVDFEIRGCIQIEGATAGRVHRFYGRTDPRFPDSMPPIGISNVARKIHILCGVIGVVPPSTKVAELGLVDTEGNEHDLDLRYGYEVTHGRGALLADHADYVWEREPPSKAEEFYGLLSVSHVVWDLGEETRIQTLSFEATDAACYPLLLAVTLE